MSKLRTKRSTRSRRGVALIVALALTLCLTMIIIGFQLSMVVQLKTAKGQRDYDRALNLAESGLNAYLNYLAKGSVSTNYGTSSSLIIPWNSTYSAPLITGTVPSSTQIRSDILAGNIALGTGTITVAGTAYANTVGLVNYPAQATLTTKASYGNQFGYFVIVTETSGATANVVCYGYANGEVRRVQAGATQFNIFDWAALWGIDPNSSENAWSISGGLSLIGGFGGEGQMSFGNNNKFYDGPGIAAGANAVWVGGAPSSSGASSPGVPAGHTGYGPYYPGVASPFIRTISRSLDYTTADAAANAASGASTGVEYYRTHNNNLTGIRYLVTNGTTVRELTSTTYTVTGKNNAAASTTPTDSYTLISNGEFAPKSSDLTTWGMLSGESFYGIRLYPGDYFFEQISMGSSNILDVRSYNDYDRTATTAYSSTVPAMILDTTYPRSPVVSNDPANPNGNDNGTSAGPREVRCWIGHASNGYAHDKGSSFTSGSSMEYTRFPSRFRCYIANTSQVGVTGNSSSNSPAQFNANMLVYNTGNGSTANNGSINFKSGAYLRGSLISWTITGSGGTTIEKVATEGGGTSVSDKLVYVVMDWKELP